MGVQLNIKSAEARELAEGIAQATGVSMTEAVLQALRERQNALSYEQRYEAVMAIVRGSRALWKPELVDEDYNDWLYDENGLPK